MARANRSIVPAAFYHLTHGCHDRQFLPASSKIARNIDVDYEAVLSTATSLLTYHITSNHVHLVVYADEPSQIPKRMPQQVAGRLLDVDKLLISPA